MRWAVGLTACVAWGCGSSSDADYRREVDRVCARRELPRDASELASTEGRALARRLDAAPPSERPLLWLRAVKDLGREVCVYSPTTLVETGALPAVPWIEGEHVEGFDSERTVTIVAANAAPSGRLDDTYLAFQPEMTWAAARAFLTQAPDEAHVLVAHGLAVAVVTMSVEGKPPRNELGLTAALTRDALTIYARDELEGTATAPRLRLASGPDGFDHATIAWVMRDVARASERRRGHQPFTTIRWLADDDLTLATVMPVLAALTGDVFRERGLWLVLAPEVPIPVTSTGGAKLVRVALDDQPAPAPLIAQVEHYLPQLTKCVATDHGAAGTIDLELTLQTNGTVATDAQLRSFSPGIDGCASFDLATWHFTPPPHTARLTIRLTVGL